MTACEPSAWVRGLVAWTERVRRHAWATVLLVLPLAAVLAAYAISHLRMNSDTGSMISENLPWRRAFLDFERAFPQFGDELQVVIEAVTPELAELAQRELAGALSADTILFSGVHAPGVGAFFDRHRLLYMELSDLEALADALAANPAWVWRLESDPTLAGLAASLADALDEPGPPDPHVLDVFAALGAALQAQLIYQPYQLSGREALGGRPSTSEERRRFVIAYPRLDFDEPLPARPAVERIRQRIAELELPLRRGVRLRITGAEAIEHEALESAIASTARAGIGALVLVMLVLFVALRSVRLCVASLLTLGAGLCTTAAFAALAVGRLNVISIAFAVLYIGLGIDYALHYVLGYMEALGEDTPAADAHAVSIGRATGRVGTSLVMSAITTAACFYAFLGTDFTGVAELGLIGGTGMLIAVTVTLTLLPALLTIRPFRMRPDHRTVRRLAAIAARKRAASRRIARHRVAVLAGAGVAALLALVALPGLRFDHDTVNLSDPASESYSTYRSLVDDPYTAPLTVSALAAGPEEEADLARRLERLPAVDRVVTIGDFVPEQVDRKLEVIGRMAAVLGPAPAPVAHESRQSSSVEAAELEARLAAVHDLGSLALGTIGRVGRDSSRALGRLGRLIRRWQRWLEPWPEATRREFARQLEQSLVGTFPESIRLIRAGLWAAAVQPADLPPDLRERWISDDGQYRLQVVPVQRMESFEEVRAFVDQVRAQVPRVTGSPVSSLEASRVAMRAFRRAFGLAVLATAVALLALLRRPAPVVLVLATLSLSGLLTFGIAAALDLPLNFANIIALPLIFGVGVDNGIHINRRSRAIGGEGLLETSTARAVLFSGLTTIASFGSLGLSQHRGLASMGQLLAIGMIAVVVCTLLILPAWLERGTAPASWGGLDSFLTPPCELPPGNREGGSKMSPKPLAASGDALSGGGG